MVDAVGAVLVKSDVPSEVELFRFVLTSFASWTEPLQEGAATAGALHALEGQALAVPLSIAPSRPMQLRGRQIDCALATCD